MKKAFFVGLNMNPTDAWAWQWDKTVLEGVVHERKTERRPLQGQDKGVWYAPWRLLH